MNSSALQCFERKQRFGCESRMLPRSLSLNKAPVPSKTVIKREISFVENIIIDDWSIPFHSSSNAQLCNDDSVNQNGDIVNRLNKPVLPNNKATNNVTTQQSSSAATGIIPITRPKSSYKAVTVELRNHLEVYPSSSKVDNTSATTRSNVSPESIADELTNIFTTQQSSSTTDTTPANTSSDVSPESITDELTNISEPVILPPHRNKLPQDNFVKKECAVKKHSPPVSSSKNTPPVSSLRKPTILLPINGHTTFNNLQQPQPHQQHQQTNGHTRVLSPVKNDTADRDFPIVDSSTKIDGWKGFNLVRNRRCGSGLHNPSNNCFLNSVLQAIVHTAQLARFLLESDKDPRICVG